MGNNAEIADVLQRQGVNSFKSEGVVKGQLGPENKRQDCIRILKRSLDIHLYWDQAATQFPPYFWAFRPKNETGARQPV